MVGAFRLSWSWAVDEGFSLVNRLTGVMEWRRARTFRRSVPGCAAGHRRPRTPGGRGRRRAAETRVERVAQSLRAGRRGCAVVGRRAAAGLPGRLLARRAGPGTGRHG